MRMPFGRKNKTGEQSKVAEVVEEAVSKLPGVAGYYGTGRKRDNMPTRFEFRRPDGKPVQPKHAERRGRGFFS